MNLLQKKIILASLLTALSVSIGYIFLFIPNVELITATVFISGFILGPLYGAITGIIAEFLFSMFNPWGVPMLPLLMVQIVSFGLIGAAGGIYRLTFNKKKSYIYRFIIPALYGFVLTLIYDIITSLSYIFFATDVSINKIIAMFISGMVFYMTHAGVNTLIFATIVPIILIRLIPHLPAYLLNQEM
ncbi:ECF transporter S component [candidate division KSB1 bacterium]|nr:ECF transporter S component [candidate division KSB1 bacterium]